MAGGKKTFWNYFDSLEGDKVVWIITLMLIMTSIVCLFSSTSRLLTGDQTRLDIVKGQLLIAVVGLGFIILCYNIRSTEFFRRASKYGFPLSVVLLVLLLSHIDTPLVKSIELNGARRILQIGRLQLHVFEVVKVAMVMYLSWALDSLKKGTLKGPSGSFMLKLLYIYIPFIAITLMVIPGSNSAAIFIAGIMFIVILLGGGNFRDMALLLIAAILLILACAGIHKISDGKYMKRIGTATERLFNDTDYEKIVREERFGSKAYYDALDEIRQPYGAKIAVHEGGLLGKGPGQSTQRYVVPDMSEDYMFSFIIEEYGLVGGILIIFLYVSLLARGALIAKNCGTDRFAKLSVAGLCLLITGQAFLHMFVNTDIGPMTGQTLPLISHGNSAFLCFSIAFGIILSISRTASRRMQKVQSAAEPLVDAHDNIDDLDILDNEEL